MFFIAGVDVGSDARFAVIEIDINAPYVAEMVRAKMYAKYGEDANTKGYESFELFTLTGQTVQISLKFHSGITEIFSNNLTSGIYLLRSGEIIFKIIVR